MQPARPVDSGPSVTPKMRRVLLAERGTLSLRWRNGKQEELSLSEIVRRLKGEAFK